MSLTTGTPWSSTVFGFGLDLAAKATAILVLGLIVQLAMGRRRPALGSAVGHACLLVLWLLPFSAMVMPPMKLACLPAGTSDPRPGARPVALSSTRAARTFDADVNRPALGPIRDLPPIESTGETGCLHGVTIIDPIE